MFCTVKFNSFLLVAIGLAWIHPTDAQAKSVQRIIGGKNGFHGLLPGYAAIVIPNRSICGGALIHESFVLTSARCLNGLTPDELSSLRIYLNTFLLVPLDSGTIVRERQNHFVHDGYVASTDKVPAQNDTAIIKLNSPVKNIEPIRQSRWKNDMFDRSPTILGFGATAAPVDNVDQETSPVLMGIQTKIISNADCTQAWGTDLSNSMYLCTKQQPATICNGDWGSPLIFDGYLVGVASSYKGGCDSTFPNIFMRISEFNDWIDTTINNNI